MKNSYFLILVGIAALTMAIPSAQATCACVCLEGAERRVCDDFTEAGADQNKCVDALTMQTQCPVPEGDIDPTLDVTTPAGTENCVRSRIYDPELEAYREVKVCDLAG